MSNTTVPFLGLHSIDLLVNQLGHDRSITNHFLSHRYLLEETHPINRRQYFHHSPALWNARA